MSWTMDRAAGAALHSGKAEVRMMRWGIGRQREPPQAPFCSTNPKANLVAET